MKLVLGIFFACISICTVKAQRVCGTAEYSNQLLREDPSLQQRYNMIEQQIAAVTNKKNTSIAARDTTADQIIYIPVVIHILYKTADENISDAQVRSQMDALNKDFSNLNDDGANRPAAFRNLAADTRIRFCLAQVDPQNRRTTGVIRKYSNIDYFQANDAMKNILSGGDNAWDSKKYLNIWVCKLNGRALGYATPPGGAADKDGVVIAYDVFGTVGNVRYPFNKGRTATHEIGHWLGLKHIWGDASCGDDGVEDTPSQRSYNYGCPSFPHVTTCSPNSNGDMFMNFMDFTDDGCMNMFSIGQKKRMRALFATNNMRNSFLVSFACDSMLVQGGPVVIDEPEAAPIAAPLLNIYPNPVRSIVTIEYKAATKTTVKQFIVHNVLGVKVFGSKLEQEKTNFDLSHLPTGIYMVTIGEGNEKITTKIVKQ